MGSGTQNIGEGRPGGGGQVDRWQRCVAESSCAAFTGGSAIRQLGTLAARRIRDSAVRPGVSRWMGCLVSRLAFLPPPRHAGASRIRGHSGLCWLRTASGEDVPALHIKAAMFGPAPPHGEELPSAKFTVLASHGNADDLASVIDRYETLAYRMGCDFFAYEYSGYSIASGDSVPSEAACYQNIQAAFDYLVRELEIPRDRIILYGVSLGSGPTVELARLNSSGLAGMILQSPFASVIRTQCPDCCAASCVLQPLDMFRNAEKLVDVALEYPCCVIHGTNDRVVPCSHGRLLHSMLRQPVPPLWAEGAGHNDLDYAAEAAYYDRMQRFVGEVEEAEVAACSSMSMSSVVGGIAAAVAGGGQGGPTGRLGLGGEDAWP